MRKILVIFLSAILLAGCIYFLNNFSQVEITKAGSEDNVSGFAWSENIGWISFNNTSGGGTTNYGVNVDSNGLISGYAWSENIGWISFNSSELSGCPSAPCEARFNQSNGEVSGWARALAYGDGWDGWIRLRNDSDGDGVVNTDTNADYGVFASGCNWDGWAWGSDVVGWIHFRGSNYGVLGSGNACANAAPSASNLSVSQPDYCASGPAGIFSWTFSDPDPGDSQSAYQVQVDNNSDFSSPEDDSGKVNSNSNSYATPSGKLSYNTTYYWRLMVWDSKGASSNWISGPQFTTPQHAYPLVNFTHSPQNPSVGEIVTFIDNSKCYSSPGNTEYNCKDGALTQYAWDFDYVAPNFTVDSTQKGNATTTYSEVKNYEVRLRITDNTFSPPVACVGSGDSPVGTTLPLPTWREIPPF